MTTVTSRDGTTIGFDRSGAGAPVILVDGALSDRSGSLNVPLAAELADAFSVVTYDRRGRGESGDTAPYGVAREIEDIEALIDAVGGSAHLYGISSGATLALDAANRLGAKVSRLAVFEPPFVVDASRPPTPPDFLAHLSQLVAADRRGEAVSYFMTRGIGLPGWMTFVMRLLPSWKAQKALAHTLPYDATVMGNTQSGRPLPADRWGDISAPILVVAGGKSPPWMQHAQRALADILPNAELRTLEGQMHIVKAAALAPLLKQFFAS